MLYLWGGYNVLVAGVGSKRNLLRRFMRQRLSDRDAALVEVNGFSPVVRHTTVINTILTEIIGAASNSQSLSSYSAKVDRIARFFSDRHMPVSRSQLHATAMSASSSSSSSSSCLLYTSDAADE